MRRKGVNMQKAVKHLSAVTGRVLFIGFTLQIILGVCWMFCNMGTLYLFERDGGGIYSGGSIYSSGSIYSVLLWIARGAGKLIPVPYYCIVYLVQIGAAFSSGYFFLKSTGFRSDSLFWRIWGSLALLTVPMSMQCHLAVIPASLTGSCLLAEFASLWKAVKEDKDQEHREALWLARTALFWLMASLLAPEYIYLGAVPVIFLFLCRPGRAGRQLVYRVVILCAFTGMILGAGDLIRAGESIVSESSETQSAGIQSQKIQSDEVQSHWAQSGETQSGGLQNSFAAVMFRRCVWSTLLQHWDSWPMVLRENVEGSILSSTSYYVDNQTRELFPYMEETFGRETAEEMLLEAVREAWTKAKGQIIKEFIWDILGYSCPPVVHRMFLEGRGYYSGSSRNYELMGRRTPMLTKYYVDYGCWWFGAGLILTALGEGMLFLMRPKGRRVLLCLCACCLTCVVIVLWYVMQGAGMMDYKRTIVICSLWAAWMAAVCGRLFSKEDLSGAEADRGGSKVE